MSIDIASIPIAFFAFLALVILVPMWLRHRTRAQALQVISDAIAKDRPADAALVEQLLAPPPPRPVGKWFALLMIFLGVCGLSVGTALSIASRFLPTATATAGMMVGALVNLGIGIWYTTAGMLSLRFLSGKTRPEPRWDYASILALVVLFLGASGLAVSTGLTIAANFFVASALGQSAADGMLVGATVNACTGIGFTALGLFILRTFATYREA